MRTAVVLVSIVLVACLGVIAVLAVSTGRGFVYAPGIGLNALLQGPMGWATLLSIVGAAAAVLLHVAARARPRSYFQLMWWRDAAWLAAMLAALVAALCYIGAHLTYGTV